MNKVFTQRECEVFAYLYDGLHMPSELLEYVVEYCVQGGHSSIRYIETVAISWHEKGIRTVDEAKNSAVSFSKDSYAVMRAFGLNDRNPGSLEREFMDRWFTTYADKILEGWKKAGVRTMEEIKRLDEQYAERVKSGDIKSGKKQTAQGSATKPRTGQNQFQNFPQREIDYDALILEQLTKQQ